MGEETKPSEPSRQTGRFRRLGEPTGRNRGRGTCIRGAHNTREMGLTRVVCARVDHPGEESGTPTLPLNAFLAEVRSDA